MYHIKSVEILEQEGGSIVIGQGTNGPVMTMRYYPSFVQRERESAMFVTSAMIEATSTLTRLVPHLKQMPKRFANATKIIWKSSSTNKLVWFTPLSSRESALFVSVSAITSDDRNDESEIL